MTPKKKRVIKAYAVMTKRGKICFEINAYAVFQLKGDAELYAKEWCPVKLNIVPITITIGRER